MEKFELKTSDVARAAGYSYQYIHDLLAGERRWNEDSIKRVSKVLNITIDYKVVNPDDTSPCQETSRTR